MTERDQSWNSSEHSVSYFDHVEQATKQLIKAGIDSDKNKQHDHTLIAFKKCRNFDKIIDNWDKKPTKDQT